MMEGNGRVNTNYDMSGLKLTFWGLLFTVINIRIQGFDIVPDVIGYLLVIAGLGKIQAYEEMFSTAKKFAYLLVLLSLINVYQAPAQSTQDITDVMQTTPDTVTFSAGVFGNSPWLAFIFMITGVVSSLWFDYFMCMGMKSLLTRIGDHTLAGICDDRWRLILVSEIGLMAAMLIAMMAIPFGAALAVIFGILALVAMVLFLLLVHHTYRTIDGKEITE